MNAARALQSAHGLTNPILTRGVGTEGAPRLSGNSGQAKIRRPVSDFTLFIAGSMSQS
jgi:hypothetical protein